jgi:ketosteroid isomerase-like protein
VVDDATRERIRTGYEAFFAGDLERVVAIATPDVVIVDAAELPDTGTLRGRGEFEARLREFHEMFDELTLDELRIEEIGERVLVVLDVRGRAAIGGTPVAMTIGHVVTLRDGFVTEMRVFLDVAAARAFAAAP